MKTLKVAVIFLAIFVITTFAYSQDKVRQARILELKGRAQAKLHDSDKWVKAKVGMVLNQGDILQLDKDSWALVNVNGSGETALLELQENTKIAFSTLLKNKKDKSENTMLDLSIGRILIKAKKLNSKKSKFEVKTPTSIVGVRGTTFEVEVEAVE